MCGVYGKLSFEKNSGVGPALLRAKLEAIRHRGSDNKGIYSAAQVALGHSRLSTIDLTVGHKPLSKGDGGARIMVKTQEI